MNLFSFKLLYLDRLIIFYLISSGIYSFIHTTIQNILLNNQKGESDNS